MATCLMPILPATMNTILYFTRFRQN